MSVNDNFELVGEFLLYIRAERALSENTVLAYTSDLWQYAEILQQRDLTLFTADTAAVAAFVQHLAKHDIGPRSRSRKIAAMRGFYDWLIKHERLDKDPTRLMVVPKQAKLLPRPIDARTVFELLERTGKRAAADDASPYELRDHAMLDLLYSAGIRVSELCGIRQQDIDRDAGTAHVRGKGNKERIVPLGHSAASSIENYQRFGRPHLSKSGKGQQRALFLSEQGTQITRQRVWQILSSIGGEDDHFHPHRMRHSCATHVLRAGGDLRVVQELLGHANLGTTQIYTQVNKDHLQEAHARFHPRGKGN